MKRSALFGLLAAALIAANARAETYQICLYGMPCAGKRWGGKHPAPKPEKGKDAGKIEAEEPEKKLPAKPAPVPQNEFYLTNDPLSRAVLRDALGNDDGIVSAVKGPGGTVVYSGKGSLDLPATPIPKSKDRAQGAASEEEEWVKIDSKTKAAGQINGMREKRKELKGEAAAAKTGSDQMWGDAAPAGGDAAPAGGDAAPARGDAAPARGEKQSP